MNSISLYFNYFLITIRGQMQYRASYIMTLAGDFIVNLLEAMGILILFHRFGSIKGWSLGEIALFYGVVQISFVLGEALTRGFDTMDRWIKRGDLDRLLLRPRTLFLQISGKEINLKRLGRFLQGWVVFIWAAIWLEIVWTPEKIFLLLFTLGGGFLLFAGLFIFQATITFWTTESLEIMATVTYGGCETGQYPLSIYKPWFQTFFIFVIPLGCVTYFPLLAIMDKEDFALGTPLWFQYVAPVFGGIFFFLILQFWKLGVRRYQSTGS